MKKYLIGLMFAVSVFSTCTTANAQTLAELQAQIQVLLQQIQTLQAKQTQTSTAGTVSATTVVTTTGAVSQNVGYGMTNSDDVRRLQDYLRSAGYFSGESSGNFYAQTFEAVKKFQAARGVEATGFVGPQTRTLINGNQTTTVVDTTNTITPVSTTLIEAKPTPYSQPTPTISASRVTIQSGESSMLYLGKFPTTASSWRLSTSCANGVTVNQKGGGCAPNNSDTIIFESVTPTTVAWQVDITNLSGMIQSVPFTFTAYASTGKQLAQVSTQITVYPGATTPSPIATTTIPTPSIPPAATTTATTTTASNGSFTSTPLASDERLTSYDYTPSTCSYYNNYTRVGSPYLGRGPVYNNSVQICGAGYTPDDSSYRAYSCSVPSTSVARVNWAFKCKPTTSVPPTATTTSVGNSTVKSLLSNVRSAASRFYTSYNNAYPTSMMAASASVCTGTLFMDVASGMANLTGNASAWPSGTTLSCQATFTGYAVSALLPSAEGVVTHWCVDSFGVVGGSAAHQAAGDVTCSVISAYAPTQNFANIYSALGDLLKQLSAQIGN